MRKLITWVFNYSLDGLMADEDTDFWQFCFSRPPGDPAMLKAQLDAYRDADVHIMGRVAYEGISEGMLSAPDHPFSSILTAAPKVVFSTTLQNPKWANTTVVRGDTAEEVEKLRQGSEGTIVVWGGVTLWRSLIHLDLIDEFTIVVYPYFAGAGTRLFDEAPASYELELVSSTAQSNGIVALKYRRPR